MNITPLDIRQKQFSTGFRGFNITEVDNFLEEVTSEMEALIRENETLKEQSASLEAQVAEFRQTEKSLRDTLMAAQKMSDDLKASAEKEARFKMKEAEMEAEKILRDARARLARTEEEITELNRIKERFRLKVRGLIEDHLKMLAYDQEDETAG